jgi:type IV secretory pathway VirB10-like protein
MSSAKGESLFRVARGERPPRALREQTLAAMRTLAREPKEAPSAGPWRSRPIARVSALAVAVAAAAGFVVVTKEPAQRSSEDSIVAERIRADGPRVGAQASVPPQVSASAPTPTRPAPAQPAQPARGRPSLAEETAALDEIRAAIEASDAARALALLDRYDRRGEGGNRMSAEAMVLRLEALVQGGHTTKARELARTFIERNPNNPLADRARAILSKLDGSTDEEESHHETNRQ